MAFKSEGFTCVEIYAYINGISDQKERCSDNFYFDKIEKKKYIRFIFREDLKFDIKRDISKGKDTFFLSDIVSDVQYDFPNGSREGLYVAKVRNIEDNKKPDEGGRFVIEVISEDIKEEKHAYLSI